MFQRRSFMRICTIYVCIALLSGCGTTREDQLERVAKDWCETIRASQVIAVYPLTQDIQPGDIFLVQTPIDKQQEIYRDKGFLPLDNHWERMDLSGFGLFYDHSFLSNPPDGAVELPKDWLKNNWADAPLAAFPSYSFSANQSGGLNLAIPVSGVPVGLSLLGTQSANGSISLKDARTFGVDTESAYRDLLKWSREDPDRQNKLANFGVFPGQKPRNYLRVVTRVYLLGAIDVQLNDARSVSAGIDAGVPKPVDLFLADPPKGTEDTQRSARENYMRGLARMNSLIDGGQDFADPSDAGLTADQIKARNAKRAELKKAELNAAEQALEKAQKDLKAEQDKAKDQTETTQLADARNNLNAARVELVKKTKALQAAEAQGDAAAIAAAKGELATAKSNYSAAESDTATKLKAYNAKYGDKLNLLAAEATFREHAVSALKDFAPGGSVRYNAASSRSISLSETFKKPLVVGYLGFDVPIGVFGELGPPIPTHALLDHGSNLRTSSRSVVAKGYEISSMQSLYPILEELAGDGNRLADKTKQHIDRMTRLIPAQYGVANLDEDKQSCTIQFYATNNDNFLDYLVYRQGQNILKANVEYAQRRRWEVVYESDPDTPIDISQFIEQLEVTDEEDHEYNKSCRYLIHAVMNAD